MGFTQNDFYNKPKYERFVSAGPAYFFGDIGGPTKNPIYFMGYSELDFKNSRPSLTFGIKRNLNKVFALRGSFGYTYLHQSDANSNRNGIHVRNLSFFTNVYEATIMPEIRVAKFSLNTRRKKSHWEYYIFGGTGLFYFNPKTRYKGTVVELQPLATEGQGLIPGTKKYSRLEACFPVGGGLRMGVGFTSSIFAELGYRVTFTDYIDDVSTSYVDYESLVAQNGSLAGELAYRGDGTYPQGRNRGNKFNDDHYLFFNIGFSTSLKSIRLTRFHGR